MSTTSDLDGKLRAIIDKQEISEALSRYCRGFDRADADILNTVYHPDAIDSRFSTDEQGMPQPVQDPGAFLAERSRAQQKVVTCHRVSTINIRLDGDVADCESCFDVITVTADGEEAIVLRGDGRYVDRFERRSGEWRIARRQIVTEWTHRERVPMPASRDNLSQQSRDDVSYSRVEHVRGLGG